MECSAQGMLEFKRILVPVDFSEGSELAARTAIGLASRFGAALELFHVWQVPALRPDLMVWAETDGMPLAEYARRNADEQMSAFVAKLRPTFAGELAARVVPGDPTTAIVERAEKGGHDLIVIGTRGLTGMAHLLIGSVAERVVRHARCPVLTVRHAAAVRA